MLGVHSLEQKVEFTHGLECLVSWCATEEENDEFRGVPRWLAGMAFYVQSWGIVGEQVVKWYRNIHVEVDEDHPRLSSPR